jgi:hypothetical protein
VILISVVDLSKIINDATITTNRKQLNINMSNNFPAVDISLILSQSSNNPSSSQSVSSQAKSSPSNAVSPERRKEFIQRLGLSIQESLLVIIILQMEIGENFG